MTEQEKNILIIKYEKIKRFRSELFNHEEWSEFYAFCEGYNLCKEEQVKNSSLCGASNSLLEIELKSWEHTCGDGCCYTDGLDIFLNGEQLDEQNAEDSVNALTAVLTKLGYKFEINCY